MVADPLNPDMIRAPFTALEVDTMNRWQQQPHIHAFTCRRAHREKLVATTDGWVCRGCDYTQPWAHAVQGDPEALRKFIYAQDIILAQYVKEF